MQRQDIKVCLRISLQIIKKKIEKNINQHNSPATLKNTSLHFILYSNCLSNEPNQIGKKKPKPFFFHGIINTINHGIIEINFNGVIHFSMLIQIVLPPYGMRADKPKWTIMVIYLVLFYCDIQILVRIQSVIVFVLWGNY